MKKLLIMSIISAVLGLAGCNSPQGSTKETTATQTEGYKSVEADEFEKIIADKNVVRLDVRTPEEYAEGHIDGALNIDVQNDSFETKALETLPKDKTIALYCRSGRRSKRAADILSAKGYKVIDLNTGYLGWIAAGKK